MDMDDDDAFLYGDSADTATEAPAAPPQPAAAAPAAGASASNGLSASMAASLAAYGIDPTSAVAEEAPEDGGVEEAGDDDDSDSDSDDDDVKLVFTGGPQRVLDLRKPQQQQANVAGIGKWAHTATAQAPAPIAPTGSQQQPTTPSKPAPAPDALTDYTPPSRPGTTQAQHGHQPVPDAIAQPVDMETTPSHSTANNGPPTHASLPHSSLPVQTEPDRDAKFDPDNLSGIIPSTGTSVFDVDVAQFEGSGQMWRRPGSDISDWFNFGFDEVTYPKYLRYRQEMEQGVQALANLGPMAQMTPEVANMLHLPVPQMQQLQQMQQMQQMMAMQGMDPAAMFAMQQGMMPGGQQGDGNAQQEEGAMAGDGQQGEQGPTQGQMSMQNAFPQAQPPARGAPAARGGMAVRGRGGVPLGPRAAAVPKGPKAGRFRDKDRVADAPSNLDYGDQGHSAPPSRDRSRSRSGSPRRRHDERDAYTSSRDYRDDREAREPRERESRSASRYDARDDRSEGEYDERDRADRREERRDDRRDEREVTSRDRYGERERYGERDRYGERERRSRRDEGSAAGSASGGGGLGPDGWESGEEESGRRRKRSRSPDEEPVRSTRSTRAKRR